jgi:hypothetical protein
MLFINWGTFYSFDFFQFRAIKESSSKNSSPNTLLIGS